MNDRCYPFSAIVGQGPMKLALQAVAVDPEIGGLLVKGPRGTGKSTLSRSLAELLPEQTFRAECPLRCDPESRIEVCPFCESDTAETATARPRFVEMPLGATPDQVIGSLSIEEAVNRGRKQLNPGLLARANRGLLYVDEVNLLPDRLVDLLLDVAASGVNRVERQGLSVEHPSKFILIGTMNPEEGRLRPQLRDRFGLSVRAENQSDPERRQELARRASAFKTDPGSFREEWTQEQQDLRDRIDDARKRLAAVEFNEGQAEWIAHRVLDSGAEGHRGDIVIRRTARALAALRERTEVHQNDLEDAFELAIEHRRSPDPDGGKPPPEPDGQNDPFGGEDSTNGHDDRDGESVIEPRETDRLALPSSNEENESTSSASTLPRAVRWQDEQQLNLMKTLRTASERALRTDGDLDVRPEDLAFESPRIQEPSLMLWVLDTSASMARRRTIGFVKSVVTNALQSDRRRWTGLVDFQGSSGSTVVPPTRRHKRLLSVLRDLPVAGETPFAEGIRTAHAVIESFRSRHHGATARVVLVSDGRVTLTGTIVNSVKDLRRDAELTLVDAELESTTWGMMNQLARAVGVQPIPLKQSVA